MPCEESFSLRLISMTRQRIFKRLLAALQHSSRSRSDPHACMEDSVLVLLRQTFLRQRVPHLYSCQQSTYTNTKTLKAYVLQIDDSKTSGHAI